MLDVGAWAPASSPLTCFTKGPRWVQEVPPRADGTKHPSAYVFRIFTELYFFPPVSLEWLGIPVIGLLGEMNSFCRWAVMLSYNQAVYSKERVFCCVF